MRWMTMSSLTARIVLLLLLGLAGPIALGAQATEKVWSSEEYTRSKLRPPGEFKPTVERLIDRLKRGAPQDEECDVARDLGHMFWWLSESERQAVDQKMIQDLADLLNHETRDEKCVDYQVATALKSVGPKARAALPVLKVRLAAEKAYLAALSAKTKPVAPKIEPTMPELTFLPDWRIDYALEQAIADIDVPDKPGQPK